MEREGGSEEGCGRGLGWIGGRVWKREGGSEEKCDKEGTYIKW